MTRVPPGRPTVQTTEMESRRKQPMPEKPTVSERPKHTPGPWVPATGSYGRGKVQQWEIRKHEFPAAPFEGDLDDEWGIYPPLGESGPVALVAGEANAHLIAAAPDLLEVLGAMLRDCAHDPEHPYDNSGPSVRTLEAARAALAKATP